MLLPLSEDRISMFCPRSLRPGQQHQFYVFPLFKQNICLKIPSHFGRGGKKILILHVAVLMEWYYYPWSQECNSRTLKTAQFQTSKLDVQLRRSGPPTSLSHAPILQKQEQKRMVSDFRNKSTFNYQCKSSVL